MHILLNVNVAENMATFLTLSDSEDELDNEICIGSYRGDIVGIRYYRGTVNNNEMVSLSREPHNPYDRNAVRVDNVYGIQVGHIKRDLARALADVVDNRLARLEGVVPFGKNNIYTMPCDIAFWGRPDSEQTVLQKMRKHGYVLQTFKEMAPQRSGSTGYAGSMVVGRPPAIKISQDQMKRELDKLFEKLGEQEKSSTTEPAEAIKSELYPHQKQALAWMIARENSKDLPPFWIERTLGTKKEYFNTATNYATSTRPQCVLGGILADDMGLGKTLEIIALIVTNFHDGIPLVTLSKCTVSRKRKNKALLDDLEEHSEGTETEGGSDEQCDASFHLTGKQDPDLSCDVNSVEQAVPLQPIRRSTRSTKKPVRYVEADVDDDDNFIKNDVDEIVQLNEMANITAPVGNKLPRAPKSKKKKSKQVDNVEKCGDNSNKDDEVLEIGKPAPIKKLSKKRKGKKGNPGRTTVDLTIKAEREMDCKGSKATSNARCQNTHHGPRPTLVICPLSVLSNWQDQFEIHVHGGLLNLYTYYGSERTKDKNLLAKQDVVLTTYQTLSSEFSKGKSPLSKTSWLRVVLDEGHIIRNPGARMSKAVNELKAERRWVVTGTPIQNSMKDMFSIINFLKLEPFTDRQWWRRTMERPVSEGDKNALGRLQSLMRAIALRRTKTQQINGEPLVKLPDRQIFVQPVELSLEERKLYDSMAKEGRLLIGKYCKTGTVLNNYADVLAILMRLRQLCCHPKLCSSAMALSSSECCSTPEELRQKLVSILITVLSSGADEECAVCLDSLSVPVITHCAHVFCRRCIEDVIKSSQWNPRCPLCRGCVSVDALVEVPPELENGDEMDGSDEWHSSSKVDALMSLLMKLRSESPSVKSLVISQFTSMLNIMQTPLTAEGFNFVRLDGKMSHRRRAEVIEEFNNHSAGSPTVFLLSLKAGGVGLNLTAASRVFLLDPAWNPAAEDQCFDRCHRLGQTKDVIITKFVVKDSVEERMLELQKKKRELMAGAFTNKSTVEERKRQRIQDVKALMDI